MGLFSRSRKDAAPREDEVLEDEASGTELDGSDEADEAEKAQPAEDGDELEDLEDAPFNRTRGPFDASEVDDEVDRVDLGALRLVPVDGMQLRLELDQEQQSVVSAHAVLGESGVQLQAFAAPRTSGVWRDIRDEIAESITTQGGTAEVVDGPLGRELVAGIPSRGPDGRTVQNRVRFLGVDGPRWFLRAVISGAAAVDDAQAEPLIALVRNLVVVRDDEARPPREALPLRVPDAPQQETEDDAEPDATRSAEDLKPFERGPEITEVR